MRIIHKFAKASNEIVWLYTELNAVHLHAHELTKLFNDSINIYGTSTCAPHIIIKFSITVPLRPSTKINTNDNKWYRQTFDPINVTKKAEKTPWAGYGYANIMN